MRKTLVLLAAGTAVSIGWAAAAQTASDTPRRTPDPARIVARLDTDRDGKISRAEWTSAGRNERGFSRGDADADGFLTVAEFRALMERVAEGRRGRAQAD